MDSHNNTAGRAQTPAVSSSSAAAAAAASASAAAAAEAATAVAGAASAAAEGEILQITREILVRCFAHPHVTRLPLRVAQYGKVVELLWKYLRLPAKKMLEDGSMSEESIRSYQRCWNAIDAFLVGRPRVESMTERVPFSRCLRTVNFCIDLYKDQQRRPDLLPTEKYLQTRQALLYATTIEVGRLKLPTNGFVDRLIDLQQAQNGALLRSVPAIASRSPHRVFAFRSVPEIGTLFGRVVFAVEVKRAPSSLQQVFVTTRRKVILKYFNKDRLLSETRKSREDPFKEIACLQWLQSIAPAQKFFPKVLDVLENKHEFVKVEQDCSTALLELVMSGPKVRIPEKWVVHIVRQLAEGMLVLHRLGFVHLDLSLENAMVDVESGLVRIIDLGFLTRIPRDPKTGHALPFPPAKLRATGKVMACAPELFQKDEPVDGTKVDVFAMGSICFCLATKDCPFDGMEGTATVRDKIWNAVFLQNRVPEYLNTLTSNRFPQNQASPQLQKIVAAAMCADPAKRCSPRQLLRLISEHQALFEPPFRDSASGSSSSRPVSAAAPAAGPGHGHAPQRGSAAQGGSPAHGSRPRHPVDQHDDPARQPSI